jgi:VWFA-related protein
MNRKFFLFFDLAFNSPKGINRAKEAALEFVNTQLQPSDEVGVLSYSMKKGVTVHEYLTPDHEKIREFIQDFGTGTKTGRAADAEGRYFRELGVMGGSLGARGQYTSHRSSGAGDRGEAADRMAEMANNLRNFDERIYKMQVSYFSADMSELAKAIRYIPGNKNIIYFSEGIKNFILYGDPHTFFQDQDDWLLDHRKSKEDLHLESMFDQMSKDLAASNCMIYPVDVSGLEASGHMSSIELTGSISPHSMQSRGDLSLKKLADLTGGKYFGRENKTVEIMDDIQELTSAYYVLGYYINEEWDGKYHAVSVKVNRKGCKAFAQGGYFNPKPFSEYSEFEKTLHLLDLALKKDPYFQNPRQFPLQSHPFALPENTGLIVMFKVPENVREDISLEKSEIISLIFDEDNNLVDLKRHELDKDRAAQQESLFYSILDVPSGKYECRVVIRDLSSSKGAVSSTPVIIPGIKDTSLEALPPLLINLPEEMSGLSDLQWLRQEDEELLKIICPLDLKRFSPVIGSIQAGTKELHAFLNIRSSNNLQAEFMFSANLVSVDSGEGKVVPLSIQPLPKGKNIHNFLIKMGTEELPPGKYSLYIFAMESTTQSRAVANTLFEVK